MVFGGESLPRVVDLGRLGALGFRIEIPQNAVIDIPTSGVGDLNGDGVTDFAFAQSANFEGTDLGRAYVIYGQPGERTFVRGDATSDSAVNITDALFILAFLFSGGEAPRCEGHHVATSVHLLAEGVDEQHPAARPAPGWQESHTEQTTRAPRIEAGIQFACRLSRQVSTRRNPPGRRRCRPASSAHCPG